MNPCANALLGLAAVLHAASAAAQADLFLEVSLNGEATGQVLRFRESPRGLRTTAANLRLLGLDLRIFGLRGDEEDVELSSLPGLHYQYDRARQSVALRLDDALREPVRLNARPGAAPPQQRATPGFVLNYDAVGQLRPQRSLLAFNELRFFNELGVFSSTGLLSAGKQARKYMRYETSWSWSDPGTLESLKLGDAITAALPWSRPVRIGGIQWRKSFDLRPDLLTYPMAAVAGSAVVPSALSVYINGIQQFGANVPAGPYVVNRVAGFSGAGQATVVTRDELGRSSVLDVPLYVDTRMLSAGLSEYALEAGFMRRAYANRSFSYRSPPLASASVRYGLNNSLTLEGHAEAGPGTTLSGGSALLALGGAGVLNASMAASNGGGRQGGLGYQYLSRRFSVDLQTLRATATLRDLARIDGALPPRRTDRASLTVALGAGSSASASYIAYDTPQARPARIASLSWSSYLWRSLFLTVSGFKDYKERGNKALSFSLSTSFGERTSASVSAGRQNGTRQRAFSLVRPPDFDGGAGWSLQQGGIGNTTYRQAQVQYLGRYGQASAIFQRSGQADNMALELAGAIVGMDGTLAAARSVGAGFALVSTGLEGVTVMHENRMLGRTDSGGYLLVPNLSPYAGNRIALDVTQIAADVNVGNSEATVAPRSLSGLLLRFPMSRYQAASIVLTDAAGSFLPPGTPVRHIESGATTIVGYDGVVFIDGLRDENRIEAGNGETLCRASFHYRPMQDKPITRIGPLPCARTAGPP
ncbi:fimbria/pilus outer membrane usher protein [Pseudoduganella violaceinigra]|uniref:fimbria/pilus outer membrane usher protein n=1 Tax=Pseudoduganella violaceinigra TaxID=246602 RepID=UPI00041A6463|nr:fimbria/pilus outer membrane usher protein [Pseudoduganella violaceinigra]